MTERPKRKYNGTQINFRCYGDEFAIVEKNAENAGLTVYEYAKRAALCAKVAPPKPPKIDKEIAREIAEILRGLGVELSKIGSNVNQIAKHYNNRGFQVNDSHYEEVNGKLEELRGELSKVWQQLS